MLGFTKPPKEKVEWLVKVRRLVERLGRAEIDAACQDQAIGDADYSAVQRLTQLEHPATGLPPKKALTFTIPFFPGRSRRSQAEGIPGWHPEIRWIAGSI